LDFSWSLLVLWIIELKKDDWSSSMGRCFTPGEQLGAFSYLKTETVRQLAIAHSLWRL